MAKLMLHRQILKDFSKLPRKVQKRISELIREFEEDPQTPAIGLHALKETMLDPKVRGVRKFPDGYRAIVIAPEKGDTFLLVHVDTHDEAYAWAKNKHFEVHEMTGIFQVFNEEEVTRVVAERSPAVVKSSAIFEAMNEDDLFHAGVPRPLIPAVQAITQDDQLDALSDYLPPDCRDVLYGLAAGMGLDEVLEATLGVTAADVKIAAPSGPGDFSRIQDAANFDLVLVEGEEHLKDILSASLEVWRIFLHPKQRSLKEWKTRGPMNITGAAGTGKTVVLMHRAVFLARGLEDTKERVLVTTYTTNLSVTIKDLVGKLGPSVADRIEVTNLHSLARTICSRSGWKGRIAEDEDLQIIWDEVWNDPSLGELPMSQSEMRNEFELIIDPNGIDNEDAYLTTVRSARPRISRKQRRSAWTVFNAVLRGLKKRSLLTFEGAIHEARLAAEQKNFPGYRHVLVDEVQDFSLEALKLIRALSPIGEELSDPLCTVGDGHQRIYRQRVPLSRAGIKIVGRSRRLKINYRTSEQIRRYAQHILQGLAIDDLDEGTTTTVGDHSVFKGPEPVVRKCSSNKEEADAIVEWVKALLDRDEPLATHEICVTPNKSHIRTALESASIKTFPLKPREMDPGSDEPGIRLGTMKRIKGLEFKAVALACSAKTDAMNDLANAELRDRCERYVAATRAREQLLVTLAVSNN